MNNDEEGYPSLAKKETAVSLQVLASEDVTKTTHHLLTSLLYT